MPISVEDFKKLVEKTERKKASEEQVVEFLRDKAVTIQELADYLGISHGAALSRAKRLAAKGIAEIRSDGKRYYIALV